MSADARELAMGMKKRAVSGSFEDTRAASRSIRVLDRVRLTEAVIAEGVSVPSGAEGTAVFKHHSIGKEDAFEIEFTKPTHAVIGVHASKLVRL
jgi:hypothetical protein